MTDRLSCDACGDDLSELREIKRWHKDDIICAVCFRLTREFDEYDFTDFRLAQRAE